MGEKTEQKENVTASPQTIKSKLNVLSEIVLDCFQDSFTQTTQDSYMFVYFKGRAIWLSRLRHHLQNCTSRLVGLNPNFVIHYHSEDFKKVAN